MGNPSKYKPEYCALLVKHMRGGLSFEAFAGAVEVNQDTLYEWANRHKAFSEAKKVGYGLARLFWESIGRSALLGADILIEGKPYSTKDFNATLWIFNMKNRFGWRNEVDVNVSLPVPNERVVKLPNAELLAIAAGDE